MSDQLFKKRKRKERALRKANREIKPLRHLIVCEGEKTEPYYFNHFKELIEEKYGQTGGGDIVEIFGTGMNTVSLVEYTERKVKQAIVGFGTVWCVFDKDSFDDEQFNTAIILCNNRGYRAIWSNECIELWFLLHFNYLTAAIDREAYREKLNEIFKKYEIHGGRYEKNLKGIYDRLNEFGNEKLAVRYAKKLKERYKRHTTPSKMKPMTKLYEIVETLNEILDE